MRGKPIPIAVVGQNSNGGDEKILIIAPGWIGDAVMSLSLLQAFAGQYSKVLIEVLASPSVAEVYRHSGVVHKVIIGNFMRGKLQLKIRWLFAQKLLRPQNYLRCYVLPNSFKSALIPLMARIPQRFGLRGEMRYGLINKIIDKLDNAHQAGEYLSLFDKSNNSNKLVATDLAKYHPAINFDESKAIDWLQKKHQINITEKKVLVICPGAEFGPAKQWSAKYYAQLIVWAINKNWLSVIIGSAKDEVFAKEIINALPAKLSNNKNYINTCGQTDLGMAVNLLGVSEVVVSNDSGLMHVAAALQKKQIAIFGSSSSQKTKPLNLKAIALENKELECRPCFKRTCKFGHYDCLTKITPQMVIEQIGE